ncbi:MAG: tRNA (adenosine(37)-N6)-threonylcarbamoyltransferase complex ATPase subunit type 1 TsaE [Clostridiales bacterium]|nr:tRNA (adenosine(37)-N6)-threonylcarbamoyltransferase complex ATPase subunit type 1 TsaE [Clostridiales bacterium]
MKQQITYSEAETRALASELASEAKSGQVFCLQGDLGVGKTAFAKGFAAGLGVTEDVVSPTFTIVREYEGRLPFYHFDIYRLPDGDSLYDIGFDEYIEGRGVCLIEWADQLREEMPEDAVWITIEKRPEEGPDCRSITIRKENVL